MVKWIVTNKGKDKELFIFKINVQSIGEKEYKKSSEMIFTSVQVAQK